MGKCRFEKTLRGEPSAVLDKVRRGLLPFGGSLDGDESAGQLKTRTPLGVIEGHYEVSGTALVITVDTKPRLLPCTAIEAIVDLYVS